MKLIASLGAAALVVPIAFVAASSSSAPPPEATTWNIDPVHTSIVFKVLHLNVSNFYGRFDKVSGTVVMNDEKPAESKVELTIAMDGINTNHEGRDKDLKGPNFFNAKEFPEIKFVSKTVKKDGDKKWKVDGDMTMHGVTKPLSLSVDLVGSADTKMGKKAGFDTTFKLKRTDFGMTGMTDMLGDEVTVMAGVECNAAK
ncbi:MAG TPA: YceI family protein [Planctomycetota bacterium]|nr:YceI family protein [Planctomycetota bacterium]